MSEKLYRDNWRLVEAVISSGSQKAAAYELGVSLQTVKNILSAMYSRHDVTGFVDLLEIAGVIDHDRLRKLTLDSRTALTYNRNLGDRPMRRIIVEGPDGAGKTTLVRQIMQLWPGLNLAPSFREAMGRGIPYAEWLRAQLEDVADPVIHDRLFYSELVYAPILRSSEGPSMSPDIQRATNSKLMGEALLIYCNVPYHRLVETSTVEEQMTGVIDNLYKIYHAYETVIGDVYARYAMRGRYLYYDFTKMEIQDIFTRLADYLK